MNTNTISNLFTGAFYIDSMYAQSCIPNLYNDLVGKNQNREKSLNDLTNTLTSEVISTENTSGPQKVIVLNFNQPVVKYRYYDLNWKMYFKVKEKIKIKNFYKKFDCSYKKLF